ncbi:MAG TPA: RNA polymerase-binding ATPase, partial [Pseudomonadales bacterium]|nr:RNA polymerase-binding ATPase [Pseudomonadales bacterium]
QKEHAELKKRVQEGRDYLLEINSSGKGKVEPLIEAIDDIDDQTALPVYLEKLCTLFGVDIEDHSDGCLILRPGDHMHAANFPHLPEDGITITFERSIALSREDMHFMTWEHPMMREAIDMILTQETGNATVSTLKNKAIKPGTVLVETLFLTECLAPRQLMLDNYLPRDVIRLVIDPKGNDLGEKVAFHVLDGQTSNLKRETAKEVVSAQESELKQALKRAEMLATQKLQQRIETALDKFKQKVTQEINRMQALAQINPNVRQDEIEFLQKALTEGEKYLANSRLKLDAVRVIVAVD